MFLSNWTTWRVRDKIKFIILLRHLCLKHRIISSYCTPQLIRAPTAATVFSFRVAQMQLHVRGRARALDCVCSIISSRLHVRVKTHVYKVLRCKSCEAWHEFCHTVVPVIAVCANNKFQNCVFNPFQARCQFNWEVLSWFKRIKLYISDVLYSPVRFPLVASTRHKLRCPLTRWRPSLQKLLCPLKVPSVVFAPLTAGCSPIPPSPSWYDYPRGRDYFAYSQAAAPLLLPRSLSSGSLAGLKSGDGKVALSRAPIWTLAAAGAAVDVLRMRKMRKSGANGQEGTMKLKWRKRITE